MTSKIRPTTSRGQQRAAPPSNSTQRPGLPTLRAFPHFVSLFPPPDPDIIQGVLPTITPAKLARTVRRSSLAFRIETRRLSFAGALLVLPLQAFTAPLWRFEIRVADPVWRE